MNSLVSDTGSSNKVFSYTSTLSILIFIIVHNVSKLDTNTNFSESESVYNDCFSVLSRSKIVLSISKENKGSAKDLVSYESIKIHFINLSYALIDWTFLVCFFSCTQIIISCPLNYSSYNAITSRCMILMGYDALCFL